MEDTLLFFLKSATGVRGKTITPDPVLGKKSSLCNPQRVISVLAEAGNTEIKKNLFISNSYWIPAGAGMMTLLG
jgi:hypothetical protein